GIKHPADPKTGDPIVMSTDFLLTVDKGQGVFEVAHTIKMKDKLLEERVLEKFEIERVYWERRGISWGIVTEEEIDKTVARNIRSEEHTSELQSRFDLVCRLLLEKKNQES